MATKKQQENKTPQQYAKSYLDAINSSDPAIRAKAFDMFPNFIVNAQKIVEGYNQIVQEGLKNVDESNRAYFEGCNKTLETIDTLIRQPELSTDQKIKLVELMKTVTEMMSKKNTEIQDKTAETLARAERFGLVLSVLSGLADVALNIATTYITYQSFNSKD